MIEETERYVLRDPKKGWITPEGKFSQNVLRAKHTEYIPESDHEVWERVASKEHRQVSYKRIST